MEETIEDQVRAEVRHRVQRDGERRQLWKDVAIASSARWINPEQPILVADSVLEAFDQRFLGKTPEPVEKPPAPVPSGPVDPVDEILKAAVKTGL